MYLNPNNKNDNSMDLYYLHRLANPAQGLSHE